MKLDDLKLEIHGKNELNRICLAEITVECMSSVALHILSTNR